MGTEPVHTHVYAPPVRPDQLGRRLRERLHALGPAPRAELLHVLMLPNLDRVERFTRSYGSSPSARSLLGLSVWSVGQFSLASSSSS
jgi:hypothetical protein